MEKRPKTRANEPSTLRKIFFETIGKYQINPPKSATPAINIPGIRIYFVFGWVRARVISKKPEYTATPAMSRRKMIATIAGAKKENAPMTRRTADRVNQNIESSLFDVMASSRKPAIPTASSTQNKA